MKTPLYRSQITSEDIESVTRVLKNGILSRGDETILFEKEFAKYVGKKYATAVSSGTTGLHILIKVMGWGEGDEVITTSFSFIATANVLLYEKIKPVFVDIDSKTLNIDSSKIKAAITHNTKGILVPHIFGLECDKSLKKISKQYKLPLIEDNCEAIAYDGFFKNVNHLGVASVYSFFCNKPLTTGEGGMIVTDSPKIHKLCQSLRDQGRSSRKDWLKHVKLGYNYRMTELQAALGRSQLKRLNTILKHRIILAKKYNQLLRHLPSLNLPSSGEEHKRSWFIYFVTFASKKDRLDVQLQLQKAGIASHIYFPSIHLFPYFKKLGWGRGDLPVSESISDRTLALPFFLGLENKQLHKITSIISRRVQ